MSKLWVENNETHPAVAYQDTAPSGSYTDYSNDITKWHECGFNLDKDYRFVRDKIKGLYVNAWNTYTTSEQLIFCEHKIGSHADRVATVGLDNVISYGLQYHSKSSEARKVRLAYAIAEVHNRLPDNAESIIEEARAEILDYFVFGIEGTAQGNVEGLTDYLNSLGSWVGNGLIDKGWTPEGMADMQELVDKIEDIILNGNY